ncbi:RluA family pseudouridine synthase [Vibrio sp.]|nr:RluA family pseudouridine synthase [Vibrio sp.]
MADPYFIPFRTSLESIALPSTFTFPFYYEPHPVSLIAVEQLQRDHLISTNWQHDFGLDGHGNIRPDLLEGQDKSIAQGKMFGVLVVKDSKGTLGFLAGFSGKVANSSHHNHFVPPVFDVFESGGFFEKESAPINEINHQLEALISDNDYVALKEKMATVTHTAMLEEQACRQMIIDNRAKRKKQREEYEAQLPPEALAVALGELAKQSVFDKNTLKYLKVDWEKTIAELQTLLSPFENKEKQLLTNRKNLSNSLQDKIFSHYQFLNANKEEASLKSIFSQETSLIPPAGAGECAAPKMLHYAFLHHYTPLCMAEFWWGVSPKSEVRIHQHIYPSCHSKCQPILGHMLKGLNVDPNPLENSWAQDKEMPIVHQDEAIVVINKPSGLLSVPGKTITDSAYTRLKALFPDCEGPFVLHRLDMATSGLLVFALTRRANKSLQKQFISREVKKRYVTLLEGVVSEEQGHIHLPMRGDPDDRPRQLVCFEHGKPAHTEWEHISTHAGQSRLYMYPHTGRTHQLRVHCAHQLGFGIPMVGDGLYGNKSDRLHLHAESLTFSHPYTRKEMTFQIDADF